MYSQKSIFKMTSSNRRQLKTQNSYMQKLMRTDKYRISKKGVFKKIFKQSSKFYQAI